MLLYKVDIVVVVVVVVVDDENISLKKYSVGALDGSSPCPMSILRNGIKCPSVDFKKCSCHPDDFKRCPMKAMLHVTKTPQKVHADVSILRVNGYSGSPLIRPHLEWKTRPHQAVYENTQTDSLFSEMAALKQG